MGLDLASLSQSRLINAQSTILIGHTKISVLKINATLSLVQSSCGVPDAIKLVNSDALCHRLL